MANVGLKILDTDRNVVFLDWYCSVMVSMVCEASRNRKQR